MRHLLAVLFCLALAPVAGHAQDEPRRLLSLIVTVDQEEMFQKSRYGQRLLAEIENEAAALAAENRQIEADLEAEELQLTKDREGLVPEAFRERAAAFDQKVVGIRAAQDAKARLILRAREDLQQRFFQETLPILTDVVRQRGAVVVLDSRSVVLSAGQIDVTADVIAQIDAKLLDGGVAAPKPREVPAEE